MVGNNYTSGDLTDELWREYMWEGRKEPVRIMEPVELVTRVGGTTHRVVDSKGEVTCVPTVGERGCFLKWKPKEGFNPVQF